MSTPERLIGPHASENAKNAHGAHGRTRRSKRLGRVLSVLLTVAIAGGWAAYLRPESLGGRTDYIVVTGVSMLPTFKAGDFVIVRRRPAYKRGDIITYRVPKGQPGAGAKVIHRIVGGSPAQGYITKGDNNPETDLWRPKPADVLGKKWLALKGFGRYIVRLRDPVPLALLSAIVAFLSTLAWQPPSWRKKPVEEPVASPVLTLVVPPPPVPAPPPPPPPAPVLPLVLRPEPEASKPTPEPALPARPPPAPPPPEPALPEPAQVPVDVARAGYGGSHRDDILPGQRRRSWRFSRR